MSDRRLMSVRSELVRETLVAAICERARTLAATPVPEPAESVLSAAANPELARLGYFVRITETDLFERARATAPRLADELYARAHGESPWPRAVAELAAALADREPRERPDPDSDAISWRIPGPGGHVRHYVALQLIGAGESALKRDVIYGFIVRCCEEASPPR